MKESPAVQAAKKAFELVSFAIRTLIVGGDPVAPMREALRAIADWLVQSEVDVVEQAALELRVAEAEQMRQQAVFRAEASEAKAKKAEDDAVEVRREYMRQTTAALKKEERATNLWRAVYDEMEEARRRADSFAWDRADGRIKDLVFSQAASLRKNNEEIERLKGEIAELRSRLPVEVPTTISQETVAEPMRLRLVAGGAA